MESNNQADQTAADGASATSQQDDAQTPHNNQASETHLIEPENPLPEVSAEELPPHWQEAIARAGWTKLMPVQAKAMPYMMAGRHMLVQAQTGSGKTGAFILPILEIINHLEKNCQALVLVPTRELAIQVAKEASVLAGDAGVKLAALYGGVKYGPQLDALKNGAQLVVGTPGRVLDHLMRRSLSLDNLRVFVMDEADRMLSIGFYPDMKEIQRYMPDAPLNVQMFSATMPPRVLRLSKEFMHNPEFLSLSRDNVHADDVNHIYYEVPERDKERSLVRIIETLNPDSAIIFCNTKARVHYVAVILQRYGYNAAELSGDVAQSQREAVLGQIREGKLRFLVATDVAARGIDIPDLSHVIQYEPPDHPETYIHRAGRTGRAGASGEAISLVGFVELMQLKRIAQRYGFQMEARPLPNEDDLATLVAERVEVMLENRLRNRDNLRTERLERFVPFVKQIAADDEEGVRLLAMLVDDYYQQLLHNPPPLPGASQSRQPSSSNNNNNKKGRRRRGRGRSRNRS